MADIDANIRAALERIDKSGPLAAISRDAWLTLADIVRRTVSRLRQPVIPAGIIDDEDVAASVMMRLQSAALRARILAADSPQAYLSGIARFVRLDMLRKIGQATVPLEGMNIPAEPPVEAEITTAAIERLRSALAGLTQAEQALVRQRFWENMSVADIARGLGEPYSRVVVRMFRLIRKLKKSMEKEDNDAGGAAR